MVKAKSLGGATAGENEESLLFSVFPSLARHPEYDCIRSITDTNLQKGLEKKRGGSVEIWFGVPKSSENLRLVRAHPKRTRE